MSATGEPAACRDGERGATLLEMMVVLGVSVLLAALIYPNLRRPYDTLSVEAARAALVSDLRQARSRAQLQDRPVSFIVAQDGRSYRWGARQVRLPQLARLQSTPATIVFTPDGGASGAHAVLWRGARAAAVIDVARQSGLVSFGTQP